MAYQGDQKSITMVNPLIVSICIEDYRCRKCINGQSHDKCPNRKGCDTDIRNIKQTFRGYDMIPNKTKYVEKSDYDKIIAKTRKILSNKHHKYDGLIFIFSGHGGAAADNYSSVLCLSPNKQGYTVAIPVKDVLDEFRNDVLGEAFVGKPRIYFIQACRGDADPKIIEADDDQKSNQHDGTGTNLKKKKKKTKYHPDVDTILVQSNTQGYFSYRHAKTGSILITAVKECLAGRLKVDIIPAMNQIKEAVRQKSSKMQVVTRSTASARSIVWVKSLPSYLIKPGINYFGKCGKHDPAVCNRGFGEDVDPEKDYHKKRIKCNQCGSRFQHAQTILYRCKYVVEYGTNHSIQRKDGTAKYDYVDIMHDIMNGEYYSYLSITTEEI